MSGINYANSAPTVLQYRETSLGRNLARSPRPESPLISIVTISWNATATVERTVNSVINQSFKDFEYIVIDGKSSDGTLEKILKYQDKIHYLASESDKGISDAFNKGVSVARGKLIGLINADDFYLPDTLQKIADHYQSFGEKIFHGDLIYRQVSRNTSYLLQPNIKQFSRRMSIMHPTVFVPKSAYENHGLFRTDISVAMDYDLLLRFARKGVEFHYLNSPLAEMADGGHSEKYPIKGLKEVEQIRREHCLGYFFSKTLLIGDISKAIVKAGLRSFLPKNISKQLSKILKF